MDDRLSIQLVGGDGEFNVSGLETFARSIKLAECGVSYAVVSIMGPQSSGKSTLLNHLFETKFKEMDAYNGRTQTTKGIWMAKCARIEPCTIVMDLEGTDGRERGEDDTAFERQSALFALAVSDIVLINIWYHDIGREQAANKPLLNTVFQVMMQLFSPDRKTTLLFVIRDKYITPLEKLEPILREDIQKIWDAVPKPQAHKETPLSDVFIVEVVALSSYGHNRKQFEEEVTSLRERFSNSIAPGGLAGDRRGVVPASGFCCSLQHIWSVIKENKDLDLPTHKAMVATVRCEEISNVKFASFCENESWLKLEETAQANYVLGFGKDLSDILDSCLSGYNLEAIYFDETVKTEKREQLESKILQLVHSAYLSVLGHLRSKTLDDLKAALDEALSGGEGFAVASRDCSQRFVSIFDEGCAGAAVARAKWDPSEIRDKLKRDIDAHITAVRSLKLAELNAHYEEKLKRALEEPVQASLEEANTDTWSTIRIRLQDETRGATDGLSSAISDFDIGQPIKDKMLSKIEEYARNVVECKAKEVVTQQNVLLLMKDRFTTLFFCDSDSALSPRDWTDQQDISTITNAALSASLKLLSVMAAIRLDDSADNIENILSFSLADTANNSLSSLDLLASSSWGEVTSSMTLLTPVQCKSLWRQFEVETEYIVTQAAAAQAEVAAAHITVVRSLKLVNDLYEETLKRALEEPVQALLKEASTDTWPAIRKLLQDETRGATDGLSSAISDFDIGQPTKDKMLSKIEEYARNVVVCKAKEVVTQGNVLLLMKDRFTTLFSCDWTIIDVIRVNTKMESARLASLKLLSVMAAIRLDDSADTIENILLLALVDTEKSKANNSAPFLDPLGSRSWEKVTSSMTLLTPVQCKSLWRQFKVHTDNAIRDAFIAAATIAAKDAAAAVAFQILLRLPMLL